ncbi:hypothetical protein [Paludibacterium denitrificans]|uniref:hypothetical protein n=1 Tax=Paludibacterium denitrificans TaxID=2675226 RepID=UPI001E604B9B|nr:hypothetical protein [Paludibacterium denitrificans]
MPLAGEIAVILPGCIDGGPGGDRVVPQVAFEPRDALLHVPFHDVELIDPPLAIIALLGREEEIPLLTVGQDRHRDAGVKGVFEELPLGPVALSDLLDLDEGDRLAGGMAQGVIHAAAR